MRISEFSGGERNNVPRKPRLVGKETYHHVYTWGNDRNPIFKRRCHYEKYLTYTEKYARRYEVDVVAYALLWWHIHLFVFDLLGNLSRFMNCLHGKYAQYFNKSTGRVGHVFGERFNSRVVQTNEYGLWLSRYIHRQAADAGLVKDPEEYEWTSYPTYLRRAHSSFLKPDVILSQFGKGKRGIDLYRNFVLGNDEGPVDWVRTNAIVVGDEKFQTEMEARLKKGRYYGDSQDLVRLASRELAVEPELLLSPRGRSERRVRHRAFTVLVERHGLSLSRVAREFGVSPTAVMKALRK